MSSEKFSKVPFYPVSDDRTANFARNGYTKPRSFSVRIEKHQDKMIRVLSSTLLSERSVFLAFANTLL